MKKVNRSKTGIPRPPRYHPASYCAVAVDTVLRFVTLRFATDQRF